MVLITDATEVFAGNFYFHHVQRFCAFGFHLSADLEWLRASITRVYLKMLEILLRRGVDGSMEHVSWVYMSLCYCLLPFGDWSRSFKIDTVLYKYVDQSRRECLHEGWIFICKNHPYIASAWKGNRDKQFYFSNVLHCMDMDVNIFI